MKKLITTKCDRRRLRRNERLRERYKESTVMCHMTIDKRGVSGVG